MDNDNAEFEKKSCVYCGESIMPAALICRYCGKNLKSPTATLKFKVETAIVCLILLVACGISYCSPYWTLQQIRTAVQQKDEDALESLVDFPKLREGFKVDFTAKAAERFENDPEMKNNPFSAVGLAIGAVTVNSLVDAFVSARTLTKILNGESPEAIAKDCNNIVGQPSDLPVGYFNYSYDDPTYNKMTFNEHYKSFDRFVVLAKSQDSSFELLLRRTGLFSWRLSKIKFLPLEAAVQSSTKQIVRIEELSDLTPLAKEAGVKEWDQLVAINGREINTVEEAMSIISLHKNDSVKLSLLRKGQTLVTEVSTSKDGKIGAYLIPEVEGLITDSPPDWLSMSCGNEKLCVGFMPKRVIKILDPDNTKMVGISHGAKVKIIGMPNFENVCNSSGDLQQLEYQRSDQLSNIEYSTLPRIKILHGDIISQARDKPAPNFVVLASMISVSENYGIANPDPLELPVYANQIVDIYKAKTYEKVVSILKSEGVKECESSFDKNKSVVYRWQNSNGSYLACIFENGKLINWYDFLLVNDNTPPPVAPMPSLVNSSTDTDWKHTDWD